MPTDHSLQAVKLQKGYYCWPWRMWLADPAVIGQETSEDVDLERLRRTLQQFEVTGRAAVPRPSECGTHQHTGLYGRERRPGDWTGNHLSHSEFRDIGFWETGDDRFKLEVLKEDLEKLNAEADSGIEPGAYRERFEALDRFSFDDPILGHVTPARYTGSALGWST